MTNVADKLRKFADDLRKQGAEQIEPKPVPNPTASLARGDLGSLDQGSNSSSVRPNKFVPKLPKVGV